jgi:hypothetical protein
MSEQLAPPSLAKEVEGWSAEQRYERLKKMLLGRGTNVSAIARLATKGSKNWPHVTKVLRGLRAGKHTWPRLVDFLTRDELIVLGKSDLAVVEITTAASADVRETAAAA